MGDHSFLPFKAEYAKSGRASCKACRDNIAKDSLRLAIMVQSPMFDGKIPNWFHQNCFWKRAKISDPMAEIHGFDSLRWEDQQKIKEKIQGGGGSSGGKSTAASSGNTSNYAVEYAKSNRSTCRGCESKIDKNEIRISKKDYETERAKMYGPQDLWHHVDCFVKKRDELEFTTDLNAEKMNGFTNLQKEDKDLLVSKLGKGEKKRKGEQAKGAAKKQKMGETKEEKSLREQSQRLWSIRDKLYKEVSNDALKGLLEYNKQKIPSGESKLLDLVSDCMAFGALKPCEECKEGQLVYSTDGYKCTGDLTSWTKCMNITKTPKRKTFKIPTEYHDVEYLKNYKFEKRERVFPTVAATTSLLVSSDSVDGASASAKPLAGMRFVFIGKTKKNKGELSKILGELGGKVVTKVDKKVAACISTKEEVAKMKKDMQAAKEADVHVVDEGFVDAVKKGGAVLLIQSHSIASWGSDPLGRIEVQEVKPQIIKKSSRPTPDESMYTKSVPKKMKMTVKGGAAVDPDSELEGQAHVIEVKGEIFNAVLGLVDLVRGTNSYYKIQALEADNSSRCWLFRAWGRVGTTIGGNKLENCGNSREAAIAKFKELYAEKTGNSWEDRKSFTKYPKKFYPLDIDYGGEEESLKTLDMSAGSDSKLPKNVQDIVKMIFDVESMKKAMLEFEIDLKKMPLGKLSKKQIEEAYKVLNELQGLIDSGGSQTKLLDASNRFYTLIPHDFGMKKPPLLDNKDVVKAKTEMLDNLLDIEVAYSLLKSGNGGGKDPLDVHYEQLKTDMKVLDKESEEYKRLVTYVKNTHASTHNYYDLEVEDIIKIEREGEYKRYKPFKALDNRMLLWHGSRTTNYAGILSQGLRIAPPEAPVTGYMFGKGIYFADMVSKSANYCRTTRSDPVGLMLLCEVALGNMYELKGAKYVTSLPKGKHSTKGIGMTTPDPSGFHTEADGTIIPMGKGTDSAVGQSSLLYNEYIVYDVSQIHMKYLFKMKFDFKY